MIPESRAEMTETDETSERIAQLENRIREQRERLTAELAEMAELNHRLRKEVASLTREREEIFRSRRYRLAVALARLSPLPIVRGLLRRGR